MAIEAWVDGGPVLEHIMNLGPPHDENLLGEIAYRTFVINQADPDENGQKHLEGWGTAVIDNVYHPPGRCRHRRGTYSIWWTILVPGMGADTGWVGESKGDYTFEPNTLIDPEHPEWGCRFRLDAVGKGFGFGQLAGMTLDLTDKYDSAWPGVPKHRVTATVIG